MLKYDPGSPDYSHYDYSAESARMYEQGKREGASDKKSGKKPNQYLYVVASPTYSHAKGYREGYDGTIFPGSYKNPRSVGWDEWSLPQKSTEDIAAHVAVEGVSEKRIQTSDNDNVPVVEQQARVTRKPARMGAWMQTASGRQFWPMDPQPEEIFIEDIAHSLSMQCRYAGHCLKFYSVAEHSVHLARYFWDRHAPLDVCLWALLHDASEAYLVDVPRPVKPFLPGYKETEAAVMSAVCKRYALPQEMPSDVHEADGRIINDERVNMAPCEAEWDSFGWPLGVKIECWSPERAKSEFLFEYDLIRDARVAA